MNNLPLVVKAAVLRSFRQEVKAAIYAVTDSKLPIGSLHIGRDRISELETYVGDTINFKSIVGPWQVVFEPGSSVYAKPHPSYVDTPPKSELPAGVGTLDEAALRELL